jgi:hypothetical protein
MQKGRGARGEGRNDPEAELPASVRKLATVKITAPEEARILNHQRQTVGAILPKAVVRN